MPYVFNPFTGNLDSSGSSGAGTGDVVGPASSTDNAVVRFDGTSGVAIQNSGVIISDTDDITGAASIALDLGATINEFSIDGTLSGNSDTAVPTEKAVKTYVDNLPSGSGDVVGPASATDNAIARFDLATGKLIQNSGIIISDTDAITGAASIALDVGATIDEFSIDGTLSGNSDTAVPTEKAVKTYVDNATPTLPSIRIQFPFAALRVNTTLAFPPISYVDLGTVEDYFRAFDDTTEEYVIGSFIVPTDIDTSGTVTFETYGYRSTGTASANMAWTFGHRPLANNEAIDGSYTDVDSGALAISTTAGNIDFLTWTETVSTLGWVANDIIIFRISRDVATDTLTGDYNGLQFGIRIPQV